MFHLFAAATVVTIADSHFMLQKGWVNRLVAGPRQPKRMVIKRHGAILCNVIPVLEVRRQPLRPPPSGFRRRAGFLMQRCLRSQDVRVYLAMPPRSPFNQRQWLHIRNKPLRESNLFSVRVCCRIDDCKRCDGKYLHRAMCQMADIWRRTRLAGKLTMINS